MAIASGTRIGAYHVTELLGTGGMIAGGTSAEYVDTGHLIYAAAATLRAVRFDLSRRSVFGDPVPVVEEVAAAAVGGAMNFAVSRTGTLVHMPIGASSQAPRSLVWVNRQGQEQSIKAPARAYTTLRLSPDDTRVAVDIRDQQNDIWIWDLARGTLTGLTLDPAMDRNPVWTPHGRRMIFASSRAGTLSLYWQAADGTGSAERLTSGGSFQVPTASFDGTRVLFNQSGDIALLTLEGPPISASPPAAGNPRQPQPAMSPSTGGASARRPELLFQTPFTEDNAVISPDGRWLAYQSNERGQPQIFVRPFPNVEGGRWQVSPDGGVKPAWARNGRELFYVAPINALMAISVAAATATFSYGNPVKLFDGPYYFAAPNRTYDVSRDSQRFLMIKESAPEQTSTAAPASLIVVVNWQAALGARENR